MVEPIEKTLIVKSLICKRVYLGVEWTEDMSHKDMYEYRVVERKQ